MVFWALCWLAQLNSHSHHLHCVINCFTQRTKENRSGLTVFFSFFFFKWPPTPSSFTLQFYKNVDLFCQCIPPNQGTGMFYNLRWCNGARPNDLLWTVINNKYFLWVKPEVLLSEPSSFSWTNVSFRFQYPCSCSISMSSTKMFVCYYIGR